jgi:hypothetical protein
MQPLQDKQLEHENAAGGFAPCCALAVFDVEALKDGTEKSPSQSPHPAVPAGRPLRSNWRSGSQDQKSSFACQKRSRFGEFIEVPIRVWLIDLHRSSYNSGLIKDDDAMTTVDLTRTDEIVTLTLNNPGQAERHQPQPCGSNWPKTWPNIGCRPQHSLHRPARRGRRGFRCRRRPRGIPQCPCHARPGPSLSSTGGCRAKRHRRLPAPDGRHDPGRLHRRRPGDRGCLRPPHLQ